MGAGIAEKGPTQVGHGHMGVKENSSVLSGAPGWEPLGASGSC